VNRSSTPNPLCQILKAVWDCKLWMEPYLGVVKDHSKYHCFKFVRGSTERAEFYYKHYSSMPWLPEEGTEHIILVSYNTLSAYVAVLDYCN